ncbi:hypothetical protein LEP1GSC202_2609 [Leptospira yanagawae serovar Saopaulo str. Sao Paulo = ATCC 700523]|uniref:Uncharacterized protein n=2 Tax=Leptospira yanagawae TaxID=293069 RepID=A0ABY2M1Y3_9LEPT|nr:hypothetical protein [Leptospira yanagawae]EOQ87186.1 hypothetical protein LEP1GSC202_2609 [Leptospira yanagawae serovar Saopaulo str. Sao Paulo = ATCC 700523]TGL21738.1 hypothetical protein EHQ46_07760 [Leptospira yanagawae]
MDYVESLLEEYFDASKFAEMETYPQNKELLESLLAIEEEICWEFNVPPTLKFRDLFRLIPMGITKEEYIQTSIQNLSREKTRYYYQPNKTVFETFKAA